MTSWEITNAELLETLRALPSNSFDGVLCDPPYELGFMGKKWDGSGVAFSVETWAEVLRVCKPGAHILAFGGTRTFHRLAVAIEDAGWEIRDCLQWIYGSGFPKSLDVGKALDKAAGAERNVVGLGIQRAIGGREGNSANHGNGGIQYNPVALTAPATDAARTWEGYGTALKPAYEPCILARKPLEGTVAANVQKWGCGALWIDGGRVSTEDKLGGGHSSNGQQMTGGWERPWMSDPDSVAANVERSKQSVAKSEELGRWPANLIHDGSPEVLAGFPETKSGVPGTRRKPHETGSMSGTLNLTGEQETGYADSGSAARFFYTAKASQRERNAGCEALGTKQQDESRKEGNPGGDNPRNRGVHARANHHPTVKPLDLCRYLATLILPPANRPHGPRRLLVPFSGSGSEMIGGLLAGWDYVQGIEREAEYVEIARARLEHWHGEAEPGQEAQPERTAGTGRDGKPAYTANDSRQGSLLDLLGAA